MVKVKITKDFKGILKGNIKDLQDKERQIRDLKKMKPLVGVFEKKVKKMLGIA